jgi:hypothetical protein
MLNQTTRKKLQALVRHPEFDIVRIEDQKMMFAHKEGKPTFYVNVKIHAHGENVFSVLAELMPELKLSKIQPYETDHGDYISFGDVAGGTIEGAAVTIWATKGEKVIEKDPAPTESNEKIIQPDYTTESEVNANA